MKILYLKLKNYSTVYTAMGLKEIEIDFSKCKNNVILLVGANGSGKTSLLSTLHAFAYNGSMDSRSNTNIIREGHDGYKEIWIEYDGDVYKIQHHYKNTKKSILVKSFIQKNDEELNPNGNVTSFNDTIKSELSLELDFLRLLRLGSNVTNLIDMKASERKSFASYLLQDIDVYTDLFKKVSDDSRILRGMIKTVSDRLVKLNVVDRAILETDITKREKKLDEYTERKNKLQQELGYTEGQINTLVPEGIESFTSSIRDIKNSIDTLLSRKSSIEKSIGRVCVVLVDDIDTEIDSVRIRLSALENKLSVNENMGLFYTEQLNPLYAIKEELELRLKKCVSNTTYIEMKHLYNKLVEEERLNRDKFISFSSVYTKDNLISLLDILKQIDSVANDIYGFDMRAVKKTISMIKNGTNIDSYINTRRREIEKDIMSISTALNSSITPTTPVILFQPPNCPEDHCPYLYLYDLIFSDKKGDKKSLSSLETEKDFLIDIENINKNIEYIYMILKSNMTLISKGNIKYFIIDNILSSISAGESIFDEDYITGLISEVEEYDEYCKLKSSIKELKAELATLASSKDNEETIRQEILNNDKKIGEIYSKKYKVETENVLLQKHIDEIKDTIDMLEKYKEYTLELNRISSEYVSRNSEFESKKKILILVKQYNDTLMRIKSDIRQVDYDIKRLSDEILNMRMTLKEFNTLTEERDVLNEKFDDISIVRESLSSNKGIPLLYMQLYLKNTKMIVNQLLKTIYSDGFELDDFDINESEFNIPYVKNNIRISDVMYASQGEKSFLSLALSFALINQSIKDYNILLLDEIDSTLDTRNRAMFLNILEKQMDTISAEQVFLITHNNMFENYPVDVILTSKTTNTNFSNANIIASF